MKAKRIYEQRHFDYLQNPVKCSFCNKELTWQQARVRIRRDKSGRASPNAFCSVDCYGKFYSVQHKTNKEENRICDICKEKKTNEEFLYKYNTSPAKFHYSCKKCYIIYRKFAAIKRKYKLTKEQWLELYKKENGKCHICKSKEATDVDHCHISNGTRGLLCQSCNIALGLLKDNTGNLQSAINYLKDYENNKNNSKYDGPLGNIRSLSDLLDS